MQAHDEGHWMYPQEIYTSSRQKQKSFNDNEDNNNNSASSKGDSEKSGKSDKSDSGSASDALEPHGNILALYKVRMLTCNIFNVLTRFIRSESSHTSGSCDHRSATPVHRQNDTNRPRQARVRCLGTLACLVVRAQSARQTTLAWREHHTHHVVLSWCSSLELHFTIRAANIHEGTVDSTYNMIYYHT